MANPVWICLHMHGIVQAANDQFPLLEGRPVRTAWAEDKEEKRKWKNGMPTTDI